MSYKYNWMYIFIAYIFMASAHQTETYIPNFCYNQKNKGSRLNTTIFSTMHVSRQVDCLIECDREPCCRSINYKKKWSSDIEKNCEMLHNVVYNTSENLLEPHPFFDHLYFLSSEKEYNASCLTPQGPGKCSQHSTLCHTNARCTDTVVGSYHCQCRKGYHGDGLNCADFDECSKAESNDCDVNANCSNTIGSYKCDCRNGFSGNGKSCSDIDECSKADSNDCDLNATCTNTIGSYKCACHSGFAGNGKSCSDQFYESHTMANESGELNKKLGEWLPSLAGRWTICWRGTEHGWAVSTFHTNCDKKKPNLVIIRVENFGKILIFGGYCTEEWDEVDDSRSAPGSFLFSLRSNDHPQPFKAPLKNENDPQAIRRLYNIGPTFGVGWDLHIANHAGSNQGSFASFNSSYESPILHVAGNRNFQPTEVEVLYLK